MYNSRREIPPGRPLSEGALAYLGIPKHIRKYEFQDFKENEQITKLFKNYIDNIHDAFDECINLTICGPNGTGKTLIASIILKNTLRVLYETKMIMFPEYISRVFNPIKDSEELTELKFIKNAEFLVIDEVGKEMDTQTGSNIHILIDLMKHREYLGHPTIICTNLTPEAIKKRYGDTIYSLITQSIVVELGGTDKRGATFKKRKSVARILN